MNEITIYQATMGDLDELSVVFDAYRQFYGQPADPDGARKFLRDRLIHRQSIVFTAREEGSGKIVGFTQLYPTFSSISMKETLVLNDLFVKESYRGRGVSHLLMQAAEDYARTTGAKGLALETANDNMKARRLYEKRGFQLETTYLSYYWTTP
ncbi:GNAT family N-acetyltransferase [Cohnella suwonensis]|uniref:GNAT family N-acetyltransferase n=1 Tax=Cohnella suwonensis TaxID=696072 RepID=A0ABW0M5R8_9BACL